MASFFDILIPYEIYDESHLDVRYNFFEGLCTDEKYI